MIKDFRKKAAEDLRKIKSVFDKRDVEFFAVCGTALGAVRESDFLLWDDDIDLAVIQLVSASVKQKIVRDLMALGMRANCAGHGLDARISIRGNTLTAIHFLVRLKDGYYFRWPREHEGFKMPLEFVEKLEEANLGDIKILVPSPPELYLVYEYGSTWKTPMKNGDPSHNPEKNRRQKKGDIKFGT